MKNSEGFYSVLFKLADRLSLLYIEHISRQALSKKLHATADSLVNAVVMLLLAILFVTTIWLGLMTLLFLYLQSYQLAAIRIVFIVIVLNIILLAITTAWFLHLKKQILTLL